MIKRLLFLLLCACSLAAHAALDAAQVRKLADDDSTEKVAAIRALVQSADPDALRVLQAMADDSLYVAGDKVVIVADDKAFDAASGAAIPMPDSPDSVTVNNRIRGELAGALAALRLFDGDPAVRKDSAQKLQTGATPELAPLLARALDKESDAGIKALLATAHAQATLGSPDPAVRLAAVRALADSTSPTIRSQLQALTTVEGEADEKVRYEAVTAVKAIESRLAFAENLGRVFSGLSLGSILLLIALGLAITYGVMGVINMAHGELLMVGAYSAYAMQSVFRAYFPDAIDWYLPAAVPVAFLAAALVGVVMERTVIRWLYGRTLETLLATWGISLVLIQAARVLFGAQNVEVSNPSWMSGGIELMPNLMLPWNRIIIIGFALFVLTLVWALMNRTRLGMFVRAVTQNRAMAGCVGVPTSRIDTLAFALGAGIAGLGGVALSQISNVGPDMGQGYIVDSFMVVVLGGVGQLAGAVWAALGLGVVSKLLEGWAGAVIAKIVVLVFIIVFIQKRPQGLFALKGRFVDN
ncbi:MAG TPA: urea ABC transporter permease subunit UrtB [Zoogloea sp.]|uniref:urea ABC transporter permease subunit UrtB n=1 Tax=Zoogloea sp. TaxID=49181 RepID=UPI002BE1614A|nr:urea ABC transporter permease subunit UrtB [Zoogloea sp.]HMV18704.1 urea ABC transporter permease subunit UrtB [Rhodocyclaceae bacterium]HMW53545.1 urea ABC transporter permease subunit UrtB [Rhodocyclaceae bacterium]HMZ77852.1 urea ABC transporter permease subunit UrtB [Rhodocyclaceae bacterium]HNA66372.1 urea ABC transporter permease subunit UrtB [Rhodocyclaceae bacterium]HNB66024.1 urea ABC transporter permease subunit UrtB [Rhodocyclaceae bacterium]